MSKEDALAHRDDNNPQNEIRKQDPSPISVDLRKLTPEKATAIASRIAQGAQFARDVVTNIAEAPETTEYVARFSKKAQEGLDSGEFKLMAKKTGEILGDVMGKSETSNRMVVKEKHTLVERTVPGVTSAQQAQTISADLYNIALQQQMAEVAAKLDEMIEVAKRIEQGQQDDRVALIEAAERELRLAAVAEDEENRLECVRNARRFLSEGTSQIAKTMNRRLQSVDGVPEFQPAIVWKMLSSKGVYVEEMDDWFNKVQDDFDVLERAYALHALCVLALDEPKMLDILFDDYRNDLASMDTDKLLTMANIHPERRKDFKKAWFADALGYVEAKQTEAKLLVEGEYIDVTITGQMLLEAIEDEAREEPGRQGAEEDEPLGDSE